LLSRAVKHHLSLPLKYAAADGGTPDCPLHRPGSLRCHLFERKSRQIGSWW